MSWSDRNGVSVVPMRRRHLPGVLRIEGKVYPKPWSLGIFLSELASVQSRYYYVAVLGRKVIGYCGLMVSLNEGHITNIAVDPDQWGRGVATSLLLNAFTVALEHGVSDMTLEVRTSNRRAQRLYFAFGFQPEGVRKGYYQETNEDAIIMWAHDIASEASLLRRQKVAQRADHGACAKAVEGSDGATMQDVGEHEDRNGAITSEGDVLGPRREDQIEYRESEPRDESGGSR
ncbi:MAG: ribosomal protein S18-alanine N-acetyltransferase [Acidimicrobiales bacterium]